MKLKRQQGAGQPYFILTEFRKKKQGAGVGQMEWNGKLTLTANFGVYQSPLGISCAHVDTRAAGLLLFLSFPSLSFAEGRSI